MEEGYCIRDFSVIEKVEVEVEEVIVFLSFFQKVSEMCDL